METAADSCPAVGTVAVIAQSVDTETAFQDLRSAPFCSPLHLAAVAAVAAYAAEAVAGNCPDPGALKVAVAVALLRVFVIYSTESLRPYSVVAGPVDHRKPDTDWVVLLCLGQHLLDCCLVQPGNDCWKVAGVGRRPVTWTENQTIPLGTVLASLLAHSWTPLLLLLPHPY